MTKRTKIKISKVFKKDLKVLGFLLINGGMVLASMSLEANSMLSVFLGGAVNYIAFRSTEELQNTGYKKALKK